MICLLPNKKSLLTQDRHICVDKHSKLNVRYIKIYTIALCLKSLSNYYTSRLQEIFADADGPDPVPAGKRHGENVWHRGYNDYHSEAAPDLHHFPTEEEMLKAWQLGLQLAQVELGECGIQPANDNHQHPDNVWFFQPHLMAGVTDAQLDADGLYADREDNQNVCIHVGGHQEAGDGAELHAPAALTDNDATELRAHLTHVAEAINMEYEQEGDSVLGSQPQNVSNTLNVPGFGAVHKTTLVARLNSCPDGDLSWDRHLRVRYGKHSHAAECVSDNEAQDHVGLFDDVALYVKDKNKSPEWRLGRVIRMRNKTRSTMDYLKPVNIHDKKYSNLYLMVNLYTKEEDMFCYNANSPAIEYSLANVIMKVTLTFNKSDGSYSLDQRDRAQLSEFLENARNRTTGGSTLPRRRNQESAVSGEGLLILEVQPTPGTSDGQRTSKRTRRQRLFQHT